MEKRKAAIHWLADLMGINRAELALLDTFETGRALRNYYYESIPKAIDALRWFADHVDEPQAVRVVLVFLNVLPVVAGLTYCDRSGNP